ncbi:uncharacterized protein LOC127745746 [Arachis duranensis]|uniref:Uncharacterized protein LOC127745746 n=1 Tax=Arachis duranensis TaxID=130453 RepID=A0A9C6TRU0_ARADU|nr:uncharacterized protein LOC127745746 [Arachis duranensis]
MAPKTIKFSRKRKGKEPATSSYNAQRFRSKLHEKHFYENTYKKAVTPEVRFALQPDEYLEIQFQIQRRGWQFLCNPHTEVGQLMVQEFYGNIWVAYKDVDGINEKNYQSYVRGKVIDFSPRSIRQVLHLPPPDHISACYSERMHRNQQLEQVLEEICISGSQWRIGAEGKPNQLKSTDLLPIARGWLDFIRRSIMPTSNRSECTVDRAVMIHCIMKGEVVEVEDIIPEQIYNIASNPLKKTRLGFPHLIYRLCEAAKVKMDNDFHIPVERPITKKTMEHLREHHRVPREDQAEEEAQQDQPPLPQGHYFPPQEYWQQLISSIEQMRITQDSRWQQFNASMEQMRVTQDNRWEYLTSTLDQMRAVQDSQRQEIFQLRQDFGYLKGLYGPQLEERDPHHGD